LQDALSGNKKERDALIWEKHKGSTVRFQAYCSTRAAGFRTAQWNETVGKRTNKEEGRHKSGGLASMPKKTRLYGSDS